MSSLKTIGLGAIEAPYASGKASGAAPREAPREAPSKAARRLAAAALQEASAALAQWAARLYRPSAFGPHPVPHPVPQLEFYAEAGAPEGALYRDGQLVGWIHGV